MTSKRSQPRWWLLYLLLPLMAGLFYLESRAPWTAGWHRAAQIGIVLITYGLIWLWLKANEGALIWEGLEKTRRPLAPNRDSQLNLVIWTFLEEETNDGNTDSTRAGGLELADPHHRLALSPDDHRDRSIDLPLAGKR